MAADDYLIWSHEHGAWWRHARRGYTRNMAEAGRYSHREAIEICVKSMPGDYERLGTFPELPVRLADVDEMLNAKHGGGYGNR